VNIIGNSGTEVGGVDDDERTVLGVVRSLLDQLMLDGAGALSADSDLSELGVDSLALVELCDRLEGTFAVTLPDEVFLTATTPHDWLASIRVAKGGVDQLTTSSIEPRGDRKSGGVDPRRPGPVRRYTQGARLLRLRQRHEARSDTSDGPGRSSTHAYEWTHLVYSWLVLVPFALSIWTLAVLPLTLATRRRIGRLFARGLCRALGIELNVDGALPSRGPFIVTANHASFIDGLVLYVTLLEPLVFVTSVEIEHSVFLGRIVKQFGCAFVERGRAESSTASVETLISALQEGKRLAIFPEGSIATGSGVRVFHLGAFEAAALTNCVTVPIGIRGTRDILRAGSFRPHPGTAQVVIGSPIAPMGTDFSARVALRNEVRSAIASLCGESTIGSG
jgi:1-acyl-sn-glycerol-3-phosphate acyltransferase